MTVSSLFVLRRPLAWGLHQTAGADRGPVLWHRLSSFHQESLHLYHYCLLCHLDKDTWGDVCWQHHAKEVAFPLASPLQDLVHCVYITVGLTVAHSAEYGNELL